MCHDTIFNVKVNACGIDFLRCRVILKLDITPVDIVLLGAGPLFLGGFCFSGRVEL